MRTIIDQVNALFAGLPPEDLKTALRAVVAETWDRNRLPSYSTLPHAVIEEVQKATFGCGIAIGFLDPEDGIRKVLLAEAGPHYKTAERCFMIPGGFCNLTETKGSAYVPASKEPEDAFKAGARELEEELRQENGSPLLTVNPEELILLDTKTLSLKSGEIRIVISALWEPKPTEIAAIKAHVKRLETDPDYKARVAAQTIDANSGQPEVSDVKIFDLAEVLDGRVALLNADQLSLFKKMHAFFERTKIGVTKKREGPTESYKTKAMDLASLSRKVEEWRKGGDQVIGVTSGTFDILHPGHVSFLEEARQHSDRLVVIIASDRTTKEQKGEDKPLITEWKRAQTIAGMTAADAVIISDEPYHETILRAIQPNLLFKGDDYAGKEIFGADLVDRVVFIPCSEKEFFSSSQLIKIIKLAP